MEVTGEALMPKRHAADSAHFLTEVQIYFLLLRETIFHVPARIQPLA